MDKDQAVAKVAELHARLTSRQREIAILEQYYRGQHPLKFASPEWSSIHMERYSGFADNWCGVVGSAPAERTEISGFRIGDDSENFSKDEKALWRDWELNEGPAQASQGFLMSTIAKRSAVIVWPDADGNPVMTWEHPSQVIVEYAADNPRARRYALKTWRDDDAEMEYATLYTADALWKFERKAGIYVDAENRTETGLVIASSSPINFGGGWSERGVDGESWPLPNLLGRVPVVEFQNRPVLGGEPISDIAGTVAMQDAVNMLWAYLFVAADYASMPARVVLGQEPPRIPVLDENGAETGKVLPVDQEAIKRGRLLWLTGENAKVDQWDAAKLDVFTDVINVAVRHIAAQTRTPIYLVHGELGNVNGETLTGLDAPLVSKVRESHKFYTPAIREVFSLMALIRGNAAISEACRVGTVQWANPEVRSDAQISDAAIKDRNVGWPLSAVLRTRYGLSQPEVNAVMEEIEAESRDPYMDRALEKTESSDVPAAAPASGV